MERSDVEPVAGRRRAPHRAIMTATRSLLAEVGYERLSMDLIARTAGVSKQTLYRWWPAKSSVVAEAAIEGFVENAGAPLGDTGDLGVDLRAWYRQESAVWAAAEIAALMRGLVAAAAENSTDAAALYSHFSQPRRDRVVNRLVAGVTRGDVRADADLAMVAESLQGLLILHALAPAEPLTPQRLDSFIDTLVRGLQPTG